MSSMTRTSSGPPHGFPRLVATRFFICCIEFLIGCVLAAALYGGLHTFERGTISATWGLPPEGKFVAAALVVIASLKLVIFDFQEMGRSTQRLLPDDVTSLMLSKEVLALVDKSQPWREDTHFRALERLKKQLAEVESEYL